MRIYPSILFDDIEEAGSWIKQAADSDKYDRMQIDFVDSDFTNRGEIPVLGYKDKINFPHLKFDAHLMVTQKNINRYVSDCLKVGFDRIIVQMESVSEPEKYSALSLDIHSPIRAVEPFLPKINYINVMSIEPGFGGQEFMDTVTEKIKLLNEWRQIKHYRYSICVDGGVEKGVLPTLEKLGVDEVVVGVKRLLQW
jgi:Pentose-5-phosphate-3-epimerase